MIPMAQGYNFKRMVRVDLLQSHISTKLRTEWKSSLRDTGLRTWKVGGYTGNPRKGEWYWTIGICHQIQRWHHPYGRKQRRTKEPHDESERGEWKVGLRLNIQKTKILASGPITSWRMDGETMEIVIDFILGAPKSLQMVTAAMKLKDACSLEEKLWPD